MAGRIRTAKARARRIDMEYFTRPHPLRRWRLLLSITAPAAALLWIAASAATGSGAPYSSGPLAPAHQVFAQKCERCHTASTRVFRAHVSDAACLTCHDAPAHQADQTFTPACATCHLEHRGAAKLGAVADGYCTQCHLNLQTTTGRAAVLRTVGPFAGAHPEFAVLRADYRDPAVLRFNHAVHMKAGLRGADGSPATLQCTTCHRTIASGPPDGSPQATGGGRMAPITYARDCASCHPLFFDPQIDRQVPHDKTGPVDAMVVSSLQAYIAAHPDQIGKPDPVRGRIPVNFPALPQMAPPRTAAEWVARRAARDEAYLWSTTCGECHDFTRPAGGRLPQEVPTAMRAVWMPHARFDHRAHRLTTCTVCHATAASSTKTSDVLMPSIATCRQCHAPARGAESGCFECHAYHDWSKATTHTIKDSGLRLRDVTGR